MRPLFHSPGDIREQRLLGFADAAAQAPEELPVPPAAEVAPAQPEALKDPIDVKEQATGNVKKANSDIQKIGSVLDNATTTATLVDAKVVSEDGTVRAAARKVFEAGTLNKPQESNESPNENFDRTKKEQLLIRENEKYSEAGNEWNSLDHGKMDYQKNSQMFQYRRFEGKDAEGKPIQQLLAYSPTGGLQVMDNGKGNWRFVSKMNPRDAAQYKDVESDIRARYPEIVAACKAKLDIAASTLRTAKNIYNKDVEDKCLKNRTAGPAWFQKNRDAMFWKEGSGNEHIRNALAKALERRFVETEAKTGFSIGIPSIDFSVDRPDEIDEKYQRIVQATNEALQLFTKNLQEKIPQPEHIKKTEQAILREMAELQIGAGNADPDGATQRFSKLEKDLAKVRNEREKGYIKKAEQDILVEMGELYAQGNGNQESARLNELTTDLAKVREQRNVLEKSDQQPTGEKKEPQKQNVKTAKAPATTMKSEAEKTEPVKEKQRSPEQEKNELTISALNNVARNLNNLMGKFGSVQPNEPKTIDAATKNVIVKLGAARNADNVPFYLEGGNIYMKNDMGILTALAIDTLIAEDFIGPMKSDPINTLKVLERIVVRRRDVPTTNKRFIMNLVAPVLSNFPDEMQEEEEEAEKQ